MSIKSKPLLYTKRVTVIDHITTGEAMRFAREEADLSLRQVAERMGCSTTYVSDLERGRQNWSEQKVEQFLKALK